jgi:hypothetical protein
VGFRVQAVSVAHQDNLEHQVSLELRVLLVSADFQVRREQVDSVVQVDLAELRGSQVYRVQAVRQE